MPVQDIIGMEATFEEDQQQTTFTTELTDAPGPEMAAADSFFDDDGFGDFEDAAWETSAEILSEASTRAQKMESVPPAAPSTVSTPTAVNKNDILSLDPAAFLDAATTTMARFSPLNKGTSSDTRNKRSGSIATLKDLENKFPPLGQNVDGSFSSRKSPSSSSSSTWEGSISQARLLHRLNLGPAPVISSLLLSQPPATRAASLRPSSSGSLYGSTVAPPPIAAAAAAPPPFPPPPAKQQRSVLAPPPPPPPQQQQQTKIMEAPLEPEPDPIVNPIVDPVASSGTAGLVDLISPAAEAPRHSFQPRANGFEELTLPDPAQALVEPPAIELERQQQQQQQEEEDKEEELRITNNENADSAFFSAANRPPYQEPFMSSRKEDHNDVALVVADEADNQEDASFNPFIVAGEEDEEKNVLERNEIEGPVVQVATGVVEEERKEEIKEVEVGKEGEMVETEDSFDAFEEAPAPAAGGGGGGVFGIEEWVTPFEVAEKEKDMDDAPVAVVQDEHEAQAVEEEEEEEEEEEVKLEESKEDFDEFEWAEADSPSVDSIGRTDAVEDIDAPLGNHRVVAPPVVEVAEEKEEAQRPVGEEPVVAAAAAAAVPLNEEIDREQEGQQRESAVKVSVVEQEATTEDDDFDDFCEAEDAPIVEQKEEEGEKAGVQTAAEVAEGLAATLPDLSFMLSDSLVKPNS